MFFLFNALFFFAFSRAVLFFLLPQYQHHHDDRQQACTGLETPDACLRHAGLLTLAPGQPTSTYCFHIPPGRTFVFLLLQGQDLGYSAALEGGFLGLGAYGLEEVDSEGGKGQDMGGEG